MVLPPGWAVIVFLWQVVISCAATRNRDHPRGSKPATGFLRWVALMRVGCQAGGGGKFGGIADSCRSQNISCNKHNIAPPDRMGRFSLKNQKPLYLVVCWQILTNSSVPIFFCKHYFGLDNLINNLTRPAGWVNRRLSWASRDGAAPGGRSAWKTSVNQCFFGDIFGSLALRRSFTL